MIRTRLPVIRMRFAVFDHGHALGFAVQWGQKRRGWVLFRW
jgi:hypothetical protein